MVLFLAESISLDLYCENTVGSLKIKLKNDFTVAPISCGKTPLRCAGQWLSSIPIHHPAEHSSGLHSECGKFTGLILGRLTHEDHGCS